MGILDGIGTFLGDEENRLNLASGLAGMTANPNAGNIQQGYQNRLTALRGDRKLEAAKKISGAQNTATMLTLKNAGVPEEILAMARNNPELTKTITSSYLKQKMGGGDMVKFSGVQTDTSTGGQYVIMSDPNTKTSTKVFVEGATQLTPQQKLDMEGIAITKADDVKMAKTKGFAAFDRANSMDESLAKLEDARRAVNNGATSGVMASFFPSFNAATTALRTTANSLGIDIINSATFGALSEKELQLALSTGLDLNLQGEELKTHIADKISAQTKMRNWLLDQASILTQSGMTYSSYIQKYSEEKPRSIPIVNFSGGMSNKAGGGSAGGSGFTLSLAQIKKMTPKQKAAFEQLTGQKLP